MAICPTLAAAKILRASYLFPWPCESGSSQLRGCECTPPRLAVALLPETCHRRPRPTSRGSQTPHFHAHWKSSRPYRARATSRPRPPPPLGDPHLCTRLQGWPRPHPSPLPTRRPHLLQHPRLDCCSSADVLWTLGLRILRTPQGCDVEAPDRSSRARALHHADRPAGTIPNP